MTVCGTTRAKAIRGMTTGSLGKVRYWTTGGADIDKYV